MVQIQHQSMAHMQKEDAPVGPEVPVHNVMPPEDESAFEQQMQQTAAEFASQLPLEKPELLIKDDPVLEKESQRREIFNKLVLLKEDHFTEFMLGGLTFKMRLLTDQDNRFIRDQIKKENPDDQLSALGLLVLATSLVEVNGVRFEEFYTGPAHIQNPVLRKRHELSQYQTPIRNALQKAYTEFQASVEGEYTTSFLEK